MPRTGADSSVQTSGVVPEAGAIDLEARQNARRDLALVNDTLVAEFSGALPAGTVIRQVARAREELLAAGVRAGLPLAAETMARMRLRDLVPAHGAIG